MNPTYKQRILRAISFIENNLTHPINLDLIARHCHFCRSIFIVFFEV